MQLLIFIFLLGVSNRVQADCTGPAGVAGQLLWYSSYGQYIYCTGSTWIKTSQVMMGSCAGTPAGTLRYMAGNLNFCDGTYWNTTNGSVINSCSGTTPGTYNYDTGSSKYRLCDGTNWSDMTSSMVGHWKLNETSAGPVVDSASGNNGTANGGVTINQTGQIGKAYNFDGVDDYIDLGNPNALKLTGAMTVSTWTKFDVVTNKNSRVIAKGGAASDLGWSLGLEKNPAPTYWAFYVASNATTWFGVNSSTIQSAHAGHWTHVAGVYKPSQALELYINGVLKNSNTTSIPASQFNAVAGVHIGKRPDSATTGTDLWVDGMIDDVRVYNRALSATEIQGLCGLVDCGLVGYWKLDETAAGAVVDSVNGINGTNNNGSVLNQAGPIGTAYSFDGVNDYVSVASDYNYNDVTMSFWTKHPSGDPAGGQGFPLNFQQDSSWGWGIKFTNDTIHIYEDINGGDVGNYHSVIYDDTWYHVAAMISGGEQKLYINGELVGSGVSVVGGTFSQIAGSLYVGNRSSNQSDYYQGLIDDVRLYGRALSDAEVKQLCDYGPCGLVANWHLNESSGTTAADTSLQAFNGSLVNMTAADWVAGKSGNALDFDGATGYLSIPATAYGVYTTNAAANASRWSFSAWIFPRSMGEGGSGRIFGTYQDTTTNDARSFGLTGTNALNLFVSSPDGTNLNLTTANNVLTMNAWNHVVATYHWGTTTGKIYVNGVEKASGTNSGNIHSDDDSGFIIGNRLDDTKTFDGLIDEIRYYNRALSASEVQTLCNEFGCP